MTIRNRGRRLLARLEILERRLLVRDYPGYLVCWVDEDGTESDHVFVPPQRPVRTNRRSARP